MPVEAGCQPVDFWPADVPFPEHHVKVVRRPQPCRFCRAVQLQDGRPAVVVSHSGDTVSWMRCRACGETFAMPTRVVEV